MPDYDPKPLKIVRGKGKSARTKLLGVRVLQRRRPRLAALLQAVQVEEIERVQEVVEEAKVELRATQKLYNECISDFVKYRNRMHLLRRKSLRALRKLRHKITALGHMIRSRDAVLARMEYEAKIGRLLNSNKQTLENLARAYLSEGEWDMVQKKRKWFAKNALTRKLRAAARKGGDVHQSASVHADSNGVDNTTAAPSGAGGGAAVVVTNNGHSKTPV